MRTKEPAHLRDLSRPQPPGRVDLGRWDVSVVDMVDVYAAASEYVRLVNAIGLDPVCDITRLTETLAALRQYLVSLRVPLQAAIDELETAS